MKMISAGVRCIEGIGLLILLIMFLPVWGGFSAYAVTSGSMAPVCPAGSLIWIKKTEDIHPGDVITFTQGDNVITHRVMSIKAETQEFITKGDANEECDARPVKREQILGKLYFFIPGLGYVNMILGTLAGKITAILFFAWLMFVDVLAADIQNMKKGKEQVKRGRKMEENSSAGSGHGRIFVNRRAYEGIYDTFAGRADESDHAGQY